LAAAFCTARHSSMTEFHVLCEKRKHSNNKQTKASMYIPTKSHAAWRRNGAFATRSSVEMTIVLPSIGDPALPYWRNENQKRLNNYRKLSDAIFSLTVREKRVPSERCSTM